MISFPTKTYALLLTILPTIVACLAIGCAGAKMVVEIDPETDKITKFDLDPKLGGTGCVWYSVSYDEKDRLVFDVLVDQAGSSDWGGFRLADSAFGAAGSVFGGSGGQKDGMTGPNARSACAPLAAPEPTTEPTSDLFIRVERGE